MKVKDQPLSNLLQRENGGFWKDHMGNGGGGSRR